MHISIISIGNSKGIRLGKSLLEKYNIKDSVEVILEKIISSLSPQLHQEKAGKMHLKQYTKMETMHL